ncbi:MAG: 50S ribosomal protein L31 [Planctomycetales bacterium]|nr:50S ribosomal protein L31 [Planctomycetales bacterium]
MKEGIHPDYVDTNVICTCGSTFTTRSTRSELRIDICSACHPFYTGKLKYIDTAGRIEKFQSKFEKGSYASLQRPKKKKS